MGCPGEKYGQEVLKMQTHAQFTQPYHLIMQAFKLASYLGLDFVPFINVANCSVIYDWYSTCSPNAFHGTQNSKFCPILFIIIDHSSLSPPRRTADDIINSQKKLKNTKVST